VMARVKDYRAKVSEIAVAAPSGTSDTDAIVVVPTNPRSHNRIDLSPWLGHGFDAWVSGAAAVLRARLASGNYSVATIVSFASNGIKVFFPYLVEDQVGVIAARPSELTRADVERYIRWLKGRYPNGATAKNYYSAFKSVIVGFIDYGYIDNSAEVLLPANPFPMNGSTTRGELSLSPTEMQRLATALKSDLVAIHHKRFGGLESEATVVLLLLIGMRSGINATPLLEMRRDCLSPHPFHAQSHVGQNIQAPGQRCAIDHIAPDRYPRSGIPNSHGWCCRTQTGFGNDARAGRRSLRIDQRSALALPFGTTRARQWTDAMPDDGDHGRDHPRDR
jgi:hypothetical protein